MAWYMEGDFSITQNINVLVDFHLLMEQSESIIFFKLEHS